MVISYLAERSLVDVRLSRESSIQGFTILARHPGWPPNTPNRPGLQNQTLKKTLACLLGASTFPKLGPIGSDTRQARSLRLEHLRLESHGLLFVCCSPAPTSLPLLISDSDD